MTCLRLLGPEAKAGRGLLGEDESGPRQDREEPGGGKDLGDEDRMVDHVMQKMSVYTARGGGGGESRVRHPLHGMSVPHTVSEKQMPESYHPLTS